MIEKEKREFGGWWIWITLLIIASVVMIGVVNVGGIFGKTVAERVIFEHSYQKSAADKAKFKTFSAQKSLIEGKLRSDSLSADQRNNLQSQLDALNIQLNSQ